MDELKIAGRMAWILTAAVAPVSYLEEQLGFAYIEVLTFEKSLALPMLSRSAAAGAPSMGAMCPHTGPDRLWLPHLLSSSL